MNLRQRIYGVVLSVPGPLSRLADRVRRSYDPNFPFIRPHVTVLPPRPLSLTRKQVVEAVRRVAERTAPISMKLGKVDTFRPVMPVVFLGFRRGSDDLRRLHGKLARVPLRAPESFPYVPHLTLGQDLDDSQLRDALALARKLFAPASDFRAWSADSLVVVERRSKRRWISLDPLFLAGLPTPGRKARRTLRRG
jgi:2'-5' RNA ligase